MTITEVAREWLDLQNEVAGLLRQGSPATARLVFTDAEIARAEVERRLAALFADGAR